ncbi:MAG: hypothetical protein ABI584_04915 [Acidobacteriota bacterium]
MKARAPAVLLGALLAGVAGVVAAPPAFGQAWVSSQGEGYVGLGYLYAWADLHLNAEGTPQDLGSMLSGSLNLSGGYTPIEHLGISGGVTYVWTRYDRHGKSLAVLPNHGPHDDEHWHGSLQDARLEVRYNVLEEPLLVTPLAGIVVPTREYETAGHAATGRGFVEAPVGLYVGRLLDPLLDGAWVQARYAYSFVENIKDNDTGEVLNLNRSNLDVEVGYYVSPSLSVRGFGAFQWTYGGLDVGVHPLSAPDFEDHDRRARAIFQKLGIGATYSTGAFDFSLIGSLTLGGQNYVRVYTVGAFATWNFGRAASFFGTKTRPAPQ